MTPQPYPRMLYKRKSLEPVIVDSVVEELRLMNTGLYIHSPAEVGLETAPAAQTSAWLSSAQRRNLEGHKVQSLHTERQQMFHAFFAASLHDASLEDLILLDGFMQIVLAGLEHRELPLPPDLDRRRVQIARQIEIRLEERLETLDHEIAALEDPETKLTKKKKERQRLEEKVYGKMLTVPKEPQIPHEKK